MDGLALCAEIRRVYLELPILMLTAQQTEVDVEQLARLVIERMKPHAQVRNISLQLDATTEG